MNDLNRSIKIFIDGTEASAGVKKIEDAITQLENKISSLDKSESGYSKKSKTLQKELENKHKTLNTYKQKVSEPNIGKSLVTVGSAHIQFFTIDKESFLGRVPDRTNTNIKRNKT